jgi:hypothetical protein
MISRVRTQMEASGAWVIDVKLFSNMSVCFNFEIPVNRTGQLREALGETDLRLTRESQESFASVRLNKESGVDHSQSTNNIPGSLQITFIHNEADLRIAVPPIPG